jgi:hypothetical protein
MVIGPEWTPLASPEEVAQALSAQPTADPAGC